MLSVGNPNSARTVAVRALTHALLSHAGKGGKGGEWEVQGKWSREKLRFFARIVSSCNTVRVSITLLRKLLV